MKRRIFLVSVILAAVVICAMGLVACNKEHKHEFGEWVVTTEPTCTQEGISIRVCNKDNSHQETQPIAALGHSFASEFTIDTAATCAAEGSKSKHCTHAGCTQKSEITSIAKLAHTYGGWQTVTPATCTEKGKEKHTCTECAHFEERDIAKLGHDWDTEFTVDTAATCVSEGSKSKHCIHAGCTQKSEITPIAKFAHTYGDWQTVTPATCTEKGTEKHICTECAHFEERDIEKLGHDWDTEFTIDIHPTCTAAGSKSIHCTRCDTAKDITAIPELGHDYNWMVTMQPSESEDGLEVEICSHDPTHTRNTRTIYALGTTGLQFVQNAEGTEYTVSGYTGTAKIVHIPAFYNNKPVTVIGVSAFERNMNITEVHMKEGIRVIEEQAFYFCMSITKLTVPNSLEVIGDCAIYATEITEFTLGNNVTTIGYSAFRYSNFTTIIIPLSVVKITNGAFSDIPNLTIFTEHATEPDLWEYYWDYSGLSEIEFYPVYWAGQWHIVDSIPAPHTYGDWQEITAPTCGQLGKEGRTCTVCGHVEERDIPTLPHEWDSEFTVDTPATCTAAGSKSIHCTRCDAIKDITAIPALGHDYNWMVTMQPTESEDGIETEICRHDSSHTRFIRPVHALGTAGLQFVQNAEGTEYTVSGYIGTAKIVHIPAFYNNKPVTVIGVSAFENNMDITEVHIKEGIKIIDTKAFYFCMSITKLTVPNSLEVIGDCAIYATNITEFTIGNNVKKIGEYAFRYSNFTTLIIPLSVVEISAHAYMNINDLTIFTEHTAKPELWNYYWRHTGRDAYETYPIYWADQWHIVDGMPQPHTYGDWQETLASHQSY